MFDASDHLADELIALIDLPLFDDSLRIRTSDVACSLSLEHWASVRVLLRSGLLSSATVVHRAQFEALARSICTGNPLFVYSFCSALARSCRAEILTVCR